MLDTYGSSHPQTVAYIEQQWLPYRNKVFKSVTQETAHYGHATTSRAEVAHARIKRFLQSSTGHLFTVHQALGRAFDHQMSGIKIRIEAESIQTPQELSPPDLA